MLDVVQDLERNGQTCNISAGIVAVFPQSVGGKNRGAETRLIAASDSERMRIGATAGANSARKT